MNARRIYMAGSGGMLGEGFHHVLKDMDTLRCTDIDTNAPWLSYLDFRDLAAYRRDVVDFAPDLLFHLGAHTNLEYCEEHPDHAYATNTLAVENAVHIANELDIPLLYIGTAGIFDGAQELYDDWDTPNPLGHYARSKYMGEKFVTAHAKRALICRAGWMMGAGPTKDKKFIQKLMRQLKDGSTELFVVDDKLGTPTYTHDFARNVDLLLRNQLWGTYNLVCEGATGRLEVAQDLVEVLGLSGAVKVTPVSSDHFAKEYFAARPASERLIAKKLELRGLYTMRNWRECLRDYIANYYEGYLGEPTHGSAQA